MKLGLARSDTSTRPFCKSGHINYIATMLLNSMSGNFLKENDCPNVWLQIIATGNSEWYHFNKMKYNLIELPLELNNIAKF